MQKGKIAQRYNQCSVAAKHKIFLKEFIDLENHLQFSALWQCNFETLVWIVHYLGFLWQISFNFWAKHCIGNLKRIKRHLSISQVIDINFGKFSMYNLNPV